MFQCRACGTSFVPPAPCAPLPQVERRGRGLIAKGEASMSSSPNTQLATAQPVENTPTEKPPIGGKEFAIKSKDDSELMAYFDRATFEQAFSVASMLAKSDLLPSHFKGKVENVFIALQLAYRMKLDPFMLMQGCYIVHNRPGFEGKFIIALINKSGLFNDPLAFEYGGSGEDRYVIASAVRRSTGKKLELRFALRTAVSEGWVKNNAKWRSMEDQMMAYRAGAFFGRLHCPEILLGFQTVDELEDIAPPRHVESTPVNATANQPEKPLASTAQTTPATVVHVFRQIDPRITMADLEGVAKQQHEGWNQTHYTLFRNIVTDVRAGAKQIGDVIVRLAQAPSAEGGEPLGAPPSEATAREEAAEMFGG